MSTITALSCFCDNSLSPCFLERNYFLRYYRFGCTVRFDRRLGANPPSPKEQRTGNIPRHARSRTLPRRGNHWLGQWSAGTRDLFACLVQVD